MKVLDLQCAHEHVFEGWFGSEEDFQSQLARNLVQCPMCGDAKVAKRLSVPRFNLGKDRGPLPLPGRPDSAAVDLPPPQSAADASMDPASNLRAAPKNELARPPALDTELIAAWMEVSKRILAQTDDVGEQFAEEARKIHYGETKERGIRGRASPDETRALVDEGIAVMPLFIPEALKRPLQ